MGIFEAREEKVIITTLTKRGKGTKDDPVRAITEVWQLDGIKIAEVDPLVEERKKVRGGD